MVEVIMGSMVMMVEGVQNHHSILEQSQHMTPHTRQVYHEGRLSGPKNRPLVVKQARPTAMEEWMSTEPLAPPGAWLVLGKVEAVSMALSTAGVTNELPFLLAPLACCCCDAGGGC